MSIVQRTRALIDRGRSDRINNVPTTIAKLDEHTDGLTQGTYILIGGETSSGKTSFARDKYMYTPWEAYKRINNPALLDILNIDFSLEITPEINNAGLISRKLFLEYDRVVPAKNVLRRLSDDNNRIVLSMEADLEEFYRKTLVFDEDVTPGKYHDILMQVAKNNGRFSVEGRFIGECGVYTPNNPNLYIQVFLDTINLGELDSGHTTIKTTIDRLSRISVWFRNKCNFTFIVLQQFHGDLATTERKRHGVTTPKMTDFEDSKRPGKDCDIAIGLYDPVLHMKEEETKFMGYDMSFLKSWFRTAHIMKNRRGERNKVIPLKFDGAVGIFSQLLPANQMGEAEYRLATSH